MTGTPEPPPRRLDSRALVLLMVGAALLIALLPVLLGRTERTKIMRAELREVLAECRTRYQAARTPAESAEVDAFVPAGGSERRPDDPACGAYRRRRMLR